MSKKSAINLTLEEKIGQMLMIGISNVETIPKIKDIIKKYKPGGIILYRNNYDSYVEMVDLINDLKRCNRNNKYPLFIAIDQENGRVNRLPKEINKMYSAYTLTKTKDIKIINETADITGKILYNSGINMNLAPVLDIKRYGDRQITGNRSFGETAKKVSYYGISFMKKLQENKVISVIKHFPGHGSTNINSHYFLPIIKNMKQIKDNDMLPFYEAINNGAEVIMVGHLLIASVSLFYPLTLHPNFIKKYLRKKDYDGIVICDDLKMKAIRYLYGKKRAVKLALKAGNDLIMVKYEDKDDINLYDKIISNAKEGYFDITEIDKSINRIIKLKEKYNLNDQKISMNLNIDDINKQINNINERIKPFIN